MNTLRIGRFLPGAGTTQGPWYYHEVRTRGIWGIGKCNQYTSGRASLYGLERNKGWLKGFNRCIPFAKKLDEYIETGKPINAGDSLLPNQTWQSPGELLSVAQKIHLKTLLRRVATTTAIVYAVKALINFMDDDEEDERKEKDLCKHRWPTKVWFYEAGDKQSNVWPWSGKMTQIVLQARIAAWMLHLDHQYTTLSSKKRWSYIYIEGMAPTPMELWVVM